MNEELAACLTCRRRTFKTAAPNTKLFSPPPPSPLCCEETDLRDWSEEASEIVPKHEAADSEIRRQKIRATT